MSKNNNVLNFNFKPKKKLELVFGNTRNGKTEVILSPAPEIIDLTGKRKAYFVVGLGGVGKSTWLTWMLERDGVNLDNTALVSILPPYDSEHAQAYHALVTRFGDAVHTPPMGDTANWLGLVLSTIMAKPDINVAIDFGAGGEASLVGLCDSLKAELLLAALEQAGIAPVLVAPLSPREDDLAPLDALVSVGFRPAATLLIPNRGRIVGTQPPSLAFHSLRTHSFYQNLLNNGAIEIWMPLCHGLQAVEGLRIKEAASYADVMNRLRITHWREAMESVFKPVIEKGWLL